jgi:nitrate/nitrite-specific signal transduction histidine kinase
MAVELTTAVLPRSLRAEMPAARGSFCELDFRHRRGGRLEAAFARMLEEFPAQPQTQFRVIVQGAPRPLEPSIRDEVCLIAREAVSNAFRHAQARSIEVELEYAANSLRVVVRDNGAGIDACPAESASDRCWGLWTMSERAKRIGARLRVFSRMAAGTEVELLLPVEIAFGTRDSARLPWLSKLYS